MSATEKENAATNGGIAGRRPAPRVALIRWGYSPGFGFAVISACWVLLLYWRALGGAFVYDDVLTVQNNTSLTSWHSVANYFQVPVRLNDEFRGFAGSIYRPLTWLGFIIERHVWGLRPAGFHATNLALHWFNGLLGFFLLRRLHIATRLAALTSLVWLALPINSEAVAWIAGRHTLHATFFILGAQLCVAAFAGSRRGMWLIAYAMCGLAALLSNEWGSLFLPLSWLILLASGKASKSSFVSLSVAGCVPMMIYLLLRHAAGAHLPAGSLAILPVGLSFFQYISWIVLPFGMSVERSTDTPLNALTAAALVSLGGLLLAVAAGFFWRKRFGACAAGLAWTLIALLPFCGIVFLYQGMAERYVYMASGGIVFALFTLAMQVPPAFQKVFGAILVLWVGWGVFRLETRLGDWQSEASLFESSLQVTPRSAVLPFNLAVLAQNAGQEKRAEVLYRRTLAANPNYVSAMVNLANLLRKKGRDADASVLLERAVTLAPRDPEAWLSLGNGYLQAGKTEQARAAYQQVLSIDPNRYEALVNLGAALQILRDDAGAKQMYGRAIAVDPSKPEPYCDLGSLLFREGDSLDATEQFDLAISKDPAYAPAYFDLGLLYQRAGNRELARELYQKALALDAHYAAARQHLAELP